MDVSFSYDRAKNIGVLQTEYLDNIREHFSVKVQKFGAARFNHFIPDRRYVITPTGQFELGLFAEIIKFLRKLDIPFDIKFTDEFKDAITLEYSVRNFYELKLQLRDYQKDIVDICLKKGFGTVVLATAGGKTLTMATLIENVVNNSKEPVKTLIIVPDIGLVNQTYSDFIEYGISANRISKWSGDNKIDHGADIIVANMGILQSEKSDISWIPHVSLLIVDECLRENTKIQTKTGVKLIQDIKIGDEVLSYNLTQNIYEYKHVLNTYKNLYKSNSYKQFIRLELDSGEILFLTPNHKIYTSRGYIRADMLNSNDDIICAYPM